MLNSIHDVDAEKNVLFFAQKKNCVEPPKDAVAQEYSDSIWKLVDLLGRRLTDPFRIPSHNAV